MQKLLFIILVLAAHILSGCTSAPAISTDKKGLAGNKPVNYATYNIEEYRIGVEDRLRISVWRNPELSTEVTVRPDGKISMPLIGDIRVGGLTPEQAAVSIKESLSIYVRAPNVAVIVTDMRSSEYINRIRVTGAVADPRSLTYRQGITILDAILDSGGVNDFAAPNRTKLYRMKGAKTLVIKIRLSDILYKGKLKTNYKLLPGDVLTVPERLF